jgi:hypothetical protein
MLRHRARPSPADAKPPIVNPRIGNRQQSPDYQSPIVHSI